MLDTRNLASLVNYGGAQQKLFPPAYLGITGMRAYAIYMRNMQSGIFRI